MVLVNAIYFKGSWLQKFDTKHTMKKDFHAIDGTTKSVDMMHLNGKKFPFFWHPGNIEANACQFDYVGKKIALTIILPEPETTLAQVEAQLTPEILNNILSDMVQPEKVNVQMPKFKLEYKAELSNHFKQMGAHLPFDPYNADFSGITTSEPLGLYISKVVHQAVVDINEEGTEAAAATGVIMMTRMMIVTDEPREFICDRPFLFIIHERTHNTALFIGKYVQP